MKNIMIILVTLLAISCSKNEHKKTGKGGLTPQPGMTADKGKCSNQNVVLGSFAYEVYSSTSLELFWNRYENYNRASQYQVVIKNKDTGNMFWSQMTNAISFYIDPNTPDVNNAPLSNSINLNNASSLWFQITAYDSYGNKTYGHKDQHIRRWGDIDITSNYTHREKGFCPGNTTQLPSRFY